MTIDEINGALPNPKLKILPVENNANDLQQRLIIEIPTYENTENDERAKGNIKRNNGTTCK